MSNFNVDEEISKTVDKAVDQLKQRIIKIVQRSEKNILRQYIASQKEGAVVPSPSRGVSSSSRGKTASVPVPTSRSSKGHKSSRHDPSSDSDQSDSD